MTRIRHAASVVALPKGSAPRARAVAAGARIAKGSVSSRRVVAAPGAALPVEAAAVGGPVAVPAVDARVPVVRVDVRRPAAVARGPREEALVPARAASGRRGLRTRRLPR